MKHVSILLLTTIIISLFLFGCSNNYNEFLLLYGNYKDNSVNTDTSSTETVDLDENEKQTKTNNLENKYIIILQSQKDYSQMNEDEMKTAQEIIENWNKLSLNFKSQYIKSKKRLQDSINRYNLNKKTDSNLQKVKEIKASYDTGITYKNISETPDDYLGQKVKFAGKIIQSVGGNPENDVKIAVDGNNSQLIFVGYDPEIIQLTLTDNADVVISGHFVDTISDLSIVNGETKIPKIYANEIDILE